MGGVIFSTKRTKKVSGTFEREKKKKEFTIKPLSNIYVREEVMINTTDPSTHTSTYLPPDSVGNVFVFCFFFCSENRKTEK